jgi:hypothetical protein
MNESMDDMQLFYAILKLRFPKGYRTYAGGKYINNVLKNKNRLEMEEIYRKLKIKRGEV